MTPLNSETGPDEPVDVEPVPVRALNDTPAAGQQLRLTDDHREDGVVVLRVAGEVDLLTATALGERIREQLVPGNRVFVLDMTDVSFLGSAGLAEIVSAAQSGAERGIRLLLVATNHAVLRPMEITGLGSVVPVFQTVDAALAERDSA